jgi:cytokinin riboside 5'-monophosphate phosphoribohydrolase
MGKAVCVYCSSSDRLDARYYTLADRFGRDLVRRGHSLVYGGGNTGLMGAVARAVHAEGGRVIGVIPEFMIARELAFGDAHELIKCITMRERKMIMEQRAEAFIALPGGWGTLEEIAEILVLKQLGQISYPVVIFNYEGFYDPLLAFFERLIEENFSKPLNRDLFRVAATAEEAFAAVDEVSAGPIDSKWFETK